MHPLYSFTKQGRDRAGTSSYKAQPGLFLYSCYAATRLGKGDEKARDFGAVELLIGALVIAVTVPILTQLLAV